MAGVSAGFASVFGTPLAGAVFGLEVLAIGSLSYEALAPCFLAAFAGDLTTRAWHVRHTLYDRLFNVPAMSTSAASSPPVAAGTRASASSPWPSSKHDPRRRQPSPNSRIPYAPLRPFAWRHPRHPRRPRHRHHKIHRPRHPHHRRLVPHPCSRSTTSPRKFALHRRHPRHRLQGRRGHPPLLSSAQLSATPYPATFSAAVLSPGRNGIRSRLRRRRPNTPIASTLMACRTLRSRSGSLRRHRLRRELPLLRPLWKHLSRPAHRPVQVRGRRSFRWRSKPSHSIPGTWRDKAISFDRILCEVLVYCFQYFSPQVPG